MMKDKRAYTVLENATKESKKELRLFIEKILGRKLKTK